MKKLIKDFFDVWNTDFNFKTFTSSALSSLLGLAFTIYNCFLGIYYSSIWNGTICIYYVLLAVVRGIIVSSQRKTDARHDKSGTEHRRKIHFVTHIIIFIMNVSLIVPIATMINGDRTYDWGMIPAISIATYTTFRIVMAITHYSKSRKTDNILVKELRTVDFIDTLVAVLTLQNTMIIASAGKIAGNMKILSIITSTAIWLFIVTLSIISFSFGTKIENKCSHKT